MRLTLSVLLLAAARDASACAACFNRGDSPDVARAYIWGGALLLTCTFGIIGSFVFAIVRNERRKAQALPR